MGAAAVRTLLAQIAGEAPAAVTLPTELVVRASTAAPG
jgi:DNA-binding LacI/PurR family transcriptional regulator